MNSHPPLPDPDITRQHRALLASIAPPAGETLVVMVCPRAQTVGRQYVLDASAERMILGREASADIVIASDSVSRRHCRLSREGQGWWIEDLLSTNGTFVND